MIRKPTVVSPNYTGIILVVDGDNTLWDTNSVFEAGQRWLLESLHTARPEGSTTLSFELLRRVDDLLILRAGQQEYNFQLLVLALIFVQKSMTETEAVSAAMMELREHPDSRYAKLAANISQDFRLKLQEIPPLLPSVGRSLEVLSRLRTCYRGGLALILLSEGDEPRIRSILKHHFGEKTIFDAFHIVERKSKDALLDAQDQGSKIIKSGSGYSQIQTQLIVVGDSIVSDIVPGNLVGAITIYIAGGYRGAETPANERERPRMVLTNFSQLPELVESVLIDPNIMEMWHTRR